MTIGEQIRAAIRVGDPEQIHAIHQLSLQGTAAELSEADRIYRQMARLDLASEIAQARGRLLEAVTLAESGGIWDRAGDLWVKMGRWTKALAAFERAGPSAVEAHARLLLRLGEPTAALARLRDRPGPLMTLCWLRLGLVEAARVGDPDLGDPLSARADLERALKARLLSGHLGAVQVEAVEPDGLGYSGYLDGERVFARVLPNVQSWSAALELYEPPLLGIPPLVDTINDRRLLVVRRLGVALTEWAGDLEATRRMVLRVITILRAAHDRGRTHGALRVDDIRVGAGGLVTLDGWHRQAQQGIAETQAADPLDLTAPEVQLGVSPTPNHDAESIRRLIAYLFTESPSSNDLETMVEWLKNAPLVHCPRSKPSSEQSMGARYVDNGSNQFTDTWLGIEVVKIPRPKNLNRLRLFASCQMTQTILALTEDSVYLAALPDEHAVELTVDEQASLRADAEIFTAAGQTINVGVKDGRITLTGVRLCIESALDLERL